MNDTLVSVFIVSLFIQYLTLFGFGAMGLPEIKTKGQALVYFGLIVPGSLLIYLFIVLCLVVYFLPNFIRDSCAWFISLD